MQLYNTLGRKKEVFKPLSGKQVKLYTCGPTVYARAHIGNFRAYIFEDVLKRTLLLNGYKVNHIMNITDVGHLTSDADSGEDKLEKGAKKEGKSPQQIAKQYTKLFIKDARLFNILPPSKYATATEYIPEMIKLVKILQDKKYVYETPEALYFDISKFKDYGKLAGLDLSGQKQGARAEVKKDASKINKADFAVWFKLGEKNKNHLQNWDSPWGKGWPGWHLECSAIAMKELGETIDIHCGGVDHIPVHHTNEVAQSESATGKKFARLWMHGEFLNSKNGRMGKSEGNAITVETLIEKGIDPLTFRYLVLQAHYRSKMAFSWEALSSAHRGLWKIKNQKSKIKMTRFALAKARRANQNSKLLNIIKKQILNMLNNDLDTPRALSALHKENNPALWLEFDKILGLGLDKIQNSKSEIRNSHKKLIEEREQARKDGDFKRADAIRLELEKQGIKIEDAESGTKIQYF